MEDGLYLIRRRSLYGAAALVPLILLAPACGHGDVEDISDNPDMLLSEGGFSSPDLGMRLVGGPLTDAEGWAHIVAFTGPAPSIEGWVDENFPRGIESRADSDDLEVVVAALGEGIQSQGDRVTDGSHGPVDFVVVVDQEDDPTVHVAMWSAA